MTGLLIKKRSNIHGVGVFTAKSIKKGNLFYHVPLKIVSHKPKPRWAHVGKNRWVSDEEVLNFINHSCDPNAILNILDQPKLIAKVDIPENAEITVDYNETESHGKQVPCNCGSKKCKLYFLRIE
jgi:SET domain-containing protein